MNGTQLGNALDITAPKPADGRVGKFVGGVTLPFATKAEAFADVQTTQRSAGVFPMIGPSQDDYILYKFVKNAIDGEDNGWDLVELITINSIPGLRAELDSKQAMTSFGTLFGTSWNLTNQPFREQSISAATAYTVTGGTPGLTRGAILINKTGADPVTFNGQAVDTRPNGMTAVTVIMRSNGNYFYDTSYKPGSGGAADITSPMLLTATIENATPNIIRLTYDEALDAASVPDLADFTPSGGKTVVDVNVAGALVTVEVDTPYANGDSPTLEYVKGANPLRDTATPANEVADLSPAIAVENNIAGGGPVPITFPGVSYVGNRIAPAGNGFAAVQYSDQTLTGPGYIEMDATSYGLVFGFLDVAGSGGNFTAIKWGMLPGVDGAADWVRNGEVIAGAAAPPAGATKYRLAQNADGEFEITARAADGSQVGAVLYEFIKDIAGVPTRLNATDPDDLHYVATSTNGGWLDNPIGVGVV